MATLRTTKNLTRAKAKKLVRNYNRRVTRNNRAFESLSRQEKRVQIAFDVLDQIKLAKLVPTHGAWIETGKVLAIDGKKVTPETGLKEIFAGLKSCNACAIGGMFLCAIQRADKQIKVQDTTMYKDEGGSRTEVLIDYKDTFGFLGKFFSHEQLSQIETAFERGEGAEQNDAGADFADDVYDASERMRLIMENIIVNNGTFRPRQQPVTTYLTPGFAA